MSSTDRYERSWSAASVCGRSGVCWTRSESEVSALGLSFLLKSRQQWFLHMLTGIQFTPGGLRSSLRSLTGWPVDMWFCLGACWLTPPPTCPPLAWLVEPQSHRISQFTCSADSPDRSGSWRAIKERPEGVKGLLTQRSINAHDVSQSWSELKRLLTLDHLWEKANQIKSFQRHYDLKTQSKPAVDVSGLKRRIVSKSRWKQRQFY